LEVREGQTASANGITTFLAGPGQAQAMEGIRGFQQGLRAGMKAGR